MMISINSRSKKMLTMLVLLSGIVSAAQFLRAQEVLDAYHKTISERRRLPGVSSFFKGIGNLPGAIRERLRGRSKPNAAKRTRRTSTPTSSSFMVPELFQASQVDRPSEPKVKNVPRIPGGDVEEGQLVWCKEHTCTSANCRTPCKCDFRLAGVRKIMVINKNCSSEKVMLEYSFLHDPKNRKVFNENEFTTELHAVKSGDTGCMVWEKGDNQTRGWITTENISLLHYASPNLWDLAYINVEFMETSHYKTYPKQVPAKDLVMRLAKKSI